MSHYGVPFSKGPEVRLDPHPNACEISGVARIAGELNTNLAIDLFCGAGGLSLGLHLAGFNVILAADREAEAAETHRAHFPGASLCADLSDAKTLEGICNALEGIDLALVAGGPPCQPYSQAAFSKVRHLERFHGRQDDDRRSLWTSFVQVVRRTMPRAVLVENVPDMAFGRDGVVLRSLVSDLEALGYNVHTRVLASDAYGVPQHRQRAFTVAFREPRFFEWPAVDTVNSRVLEDAIGDLPEVEGGDKLEKRAYSAEPTTLQKFYREFVPDEEADVIYDHYTRAVRADDLEAFKLMDSKTKYSDLPDHLKRYRDDIFEDKYKRLNLRELSRTITAHISQDGYWYIHPTQHRTLTVREAARIQTFPDHFRFCGYPRHAFKQIGEAVPPLLGKAVAESILQALNNEVIDRRPSSHETFATAVQWFGTTRADEMRMPWLASSTNWEKILGLLLFDRCGSTASTLYQSTIDRWSAPPGLLDDPDAAEYASTRFKFEAYDSLCSIAKALSQGAQITPELLQAAGVAPTTALRILAATGSGTRRPLNAALERLVRRFTGVTPSPEDGRGSAEMLFGRMVGIDEDGVAFCAMNEIAARYCCPVPKACHECPLNTMCAHRRVNGASRGEAPLELEIAGAAP